MFDYFKRLFLVLFYDLNDIYDRIVEKRIEYLFLRYLIYIIVLQVVEILSERSLFAADRIYEILGKIVFVVLYIEKLIYGYVEQVAYYEFHSRSLVRPRSVRVLVEFGKRNLRDCSYGQLARFLFKEVNLIRRVQEFLYIYIEYNV